MILFIILFPIFLLFMPFLIEFISKRINPNYETYSEFLSKMSDAEKLEYMRARRKYRKRPNLFLTSPFRAMRKRVKPNYRRK